MCVWSCGLKFTGNYFLLMIFVCIYIYIYIYIYMYVCFHLCMCIIHVLFNMGKFF